MAKHTPDCHKWLPGQWNIHLNEWLYWEYNSRKILVEPRKFLFEFFSHNNVFLSKFCHIKLSILFRKNLACLIHLATYKREKRDCNSFLVQLLFTDQDEHIALIISNFSEGIDMVKSTVLTTILRQVTCVLGGTNFLLLTVRPSSASNSCNLT